ncbi:MAG: DUF6573 family protein [Pseudomonadota bacterium]
MTPTHSTDPIFGEVVFQYTREEAIADGVLIDATELARDVGFRYPVALTAAVWEDCVAWDDTDSERQIHQDLIGRLWDVLFLAGHGARSANAGSKRVSFEIDRIPRDGQSTRAETTVLIMVIGPGDNGEPVITILQPHED